MLRLVWWAIGVGITFLFWAYNLPMWLIVISAAIDVIGFPQAYQALKKD